MQNTLKEEIQLYRSYLAEAKREERQREQELDSLLSAEVEKQWARRTEQWHKEREARRKLMDDVMKTRRQQIQEKCRLCSPHNFMLHSLSLLHIIVGALEEEKRAAAAEREALIANYKQHLQIEKEQQESKRKVDMMLYRVSFEEVHARALACASSACLHFGFGKTNMHAWACRY